MQVSLELAYKVAKSHDIGACLSKDMLWLDGG